jgi:hypothetical protein
MSYEKSMEITDKIDHGDLSVKPGWVRWSIHPTTTNEEVSVMMCALKDITKNIATYSADYIYDKHYNHFKHKNERTDAYPVEDWFCLA